MYNPLVKITTYKDYLVVTLLNKGVKIRHVGVGTQFVGFINKDLLLSNEALQIFKTKLNEDKKEDPAMELINPFNIWWRGQMGLILPADEIINVYGLPNYTLCENEVDVKVKEIIDNKKPEDF